MLLNPLDRGPERAQQGHTLWNTSNEKEREQKIENMGAGHVHETCGLKPKRKVGKTYTRLDKMKGTVH